MSVIEYKWIKPPLNAYKQFFEIVGWTSVMAVSDETLRSAIDNSWQWVSVFDDGRLIGFYRLCLSTVSRRKRNPAVRLIGSC
jgi:hypothetical protein